MPERSRSGAPTPPHRRAPISLAYQQHLMWWRGALATLAVLLTTSGLLAAPPAPPAAPPGPDAPVLALTAAAVDAANCHAFGDGQDLGPAPVPVLEELLGLRAGPAANAWVTAPLAGEVRRFRLAFITPVAAGTLCTEYTDANAVALLKANAPYPGDVNDDAQWQALPAGPVKLLPAELPLRALRFTQRSYNQAWEQHRRPASLRAALLLRGRYWCPALRGSAAWTQAGTTATWLGYWPVTEPLAGVAWLALPGQAATASAAPALGELHPTLVPAATWAAQPAVTCAIGGPQLTGLPAGVTTVALRLQVTGWPAGVADRPAVLPLVALAPGADAPTSFVPPVPFSFKYDMPLEGFAAIAVTDQAGQIVRRLVAEVPRAKGPVDEGFDLKDDAGNYLAPGTYSWRGVVRPPLKLTYETTVYNAGQPPWRAPVPGGGWWMADHAPPCSATAVGNLLFFGAQGHEFGVSLIATDLEGHKVWHSDNESAARLTSDGHYAYSVNDDGVTRIDPANGFATRRLVHFTYSEVLPGHDASYITSDRSGAAAKDGLLVVSYNGREPAWITSALGPGDVNLGQSFPPPDPHKVHETAYTPAEQILGALGTITSSQQAEWGPPVKQGTLAQVLLARFTREVPVGTVMLPSGDIQVYALRPGKALPPGFIAGKMEVPGGATPLTAHGDDDGGLLTLGADADTRFDEKTWVPFSTGKAGCATLAVPPTGLRTAALVFSSPNLQKLPYSLSLNRRYRDVAPSGQLIALEGTLAPTGAWRTSRVGGQPISSGNAPTAGLIWPAPTPVRGFAILDPMPRAGVAVDVWSGAADATITAADFKDDAKWKQVFVHHQITNNMKMNWHYHRVLTGDLGQTMALRALRVRLVEPPNMEQAPVGGFSGIVAFQPLLTGDPELPATYAQRLTLVQLPTAAQPAGEAKILRHLHLDHPGALTFDPAGTLYVATDRGIVRIADVANQPDPPQSTVVVPRDQCGAPRSLVVDAAGLLYVLDRATCTIRVFDAQTGAFQRSIGTPGGGQLGPWDPTRLPEPTTMAMDANHKLWVVEQAFAPKRISRWSTDGKFEKELLGPTHYGGGGIMDAGDHSVINHLGMKFRIDWATHDWKLESILWGYGSRGMFAPDRAVYVQGHRYLVGDRSLVTPFGDGGPTMNICVEQDGIARPLVLAGTLSGWRAFGANQAVLKATDKLDADHTSFVWSDLNRDGIAQMDEVQLLPGAAFHGAAGIGADLSLNFRGDGATPGCRLRVKELRADGLPLYDLKALETLPELTNATWVTASGETFVMGHKLLDAAGHQLWTYPDRYMSVQASYQTPWGFVNRPPGVLVGGLVPIGDFKIAGEELFGVLGNNGDQYLFTHDGLLAAAVLGGPDGYGRRYFSMPECEPGKTDLSDLRNTVETFHGCIVRAEDGKVYTIAGKNHISVIRVDGLEQLQRLSGTLVVTAADVQRAMAWAAEKARIEQSLRRPAIATIPYLGKPPIIDGDLISDWPGAQPLTMRVAYDLHQQVSESYTAQLAYDAQNLYLGVRGFGNTPLLNNASDKEVLFKYGDAFDLHLGLDPAADPKRPAAVPGDVRLLISLVKDQPVAMLYRYQLATGSGHARTFTSPVGHEDVADIRDLTAQIKLKIVRQANGPGHNTYFIEAAIPWAVLGASAPHAPATLRGDVGVLIADPEVTTTAVRYYWANKANVIMSDLPGEARVLPALWGEFRFAPQDLDHALQDDGSGSDTLLK